MRFSFFFDILKTKTKNVREMMRRKNQADIAEAELEKL
jgi:hypothetical protein